MSIPKFFRDSDNKFSYSYESPKPKRLSTKEFVALRNKHRSLIDMAGNCLSEWLENDQSTYEIYANKMGIKPYETELKET
jgi:hypothetical protein